MNIKEISYNEMLGSVMEQLPHGAFLTVQKGDIINTMTVGWCMVGYMWNRPVFQILVRTSRYTYGLFEKNSAFTVSFPLSGDMNDKLIFCGSHSGRDVNKIEACGLTLFPARKVGVPVIEDCDLFYECRIVAQQKLPIENLRDNHSHEPDDGHYHVMFYGEIVSCYRKQESI